MLWTLAIPALVLFICGLIVAVGAYQDFKVKVRDGLIVGAIAIALITCAVLVMRHATTCS